MIKRVMLPFDEARKVHLRKLKEQHINFEKDLKDRPENVHGIFRRYWESIRSLDIDLDNDSRVEDGGMGCFETYLVHACGVNVYVPKWCTVKVEA